MFDKVFQVYGHLLPNDAVSYIIIDFANMLTEYNICNVVFSTSGSKDINPNLIKQFDINDLKNEITSKTLVVFHFANPTPLTYLISALNCPKVLLFHNITPPIFFDKYNPNNIKNNLAAGYRQVFYMSRYFSHAWGVSGFNCRQLQEAGFRNTAAANPPYDFSRYNFSSGKKTKNKKELTNILFVGRISPNKRHEDIIRAFYYYHRINQKSILSLVGSYEGFEEYKNDLEKLAVDLNIPVNITGMVTVKELSEYYQNADLFLCMSEHEGFCIPLIEAMYFGIPVIAFDSSAVTETVGDAGIIFKQKHFPSVAHLMNEVLSTFNLREKMIKNGKERALYYSKENVCKRNMNLIENYSLELGIK